MCGCMIIQPIAQGKGIQKKLIPLLCNNCFYLVNIAWFEQLYSKSVKVYTHRLTILLSIAIWLEWPLSYQAFMTYQLKKLRAYL